MLDFMSIKKLKILSKNNNHIIGIMIILAMSLIIFYRNFSEDGQLLYVDMLFPSDIYRTFEFFSDGWYPYGSFSLIPITLQRLPWILITIIPAIILNINIDNYLLFLFIFTFFISGLGSYFLTYYTINILEPKNRFFVSFASCFASLIYMYNPLSLGLMWAHGFYITYALLPVIILFIIVSLNTPNNNKKLYIFIISFLMMISSTSMHGIIWLFIVSTLSFIFFTFTNYDHKKSCVNLKILLSILIIYLAMMSYWFLPSLFIMFNGTAQNIQPPYIFTESMLNFLSNMSSLDNSIRLMSGTRFLVSPSFIGLDIREINIPEITASLAYSSITNPSSIYDIFWIISSYFIPICAISSLLLYRDSPLKRMIYYFFILSVISIFLSVGTNSPFPYIYKWMAMDAPWSHYFGWILRAPYRFLIFAAIGLSTMCGYSIFKILDIGSKYKRIRFLCVATVISISICIIYFLMPVSIAHANYIFSPTKIPEEYDKVNNWLANQDGFKVLWLPKYPSDGYFPNWAPYKRIGPINIVSSNKESITNFFSGQQVTDYMDRIDKYLRHDEDNYGRLVLGSTIYVDDSAYRLDIGKIITPLGVKYIILDNSMKDAIDIKENLDRSSDLKLIFNENFIYVYENMNFDEYGIDKIIKIENIDQYIFLSQSMINFPKVVLVDKNTTFGTSIENIIINLINNPSFEDGINISTNLPYYWYPIFEDIFNISLDDNTKSSGKYSTRIETNNNKSIGWIKGNMIPVIPGEWLMTDINMKTYNVKWAHFVVYGYNNESKNWIQIIHSPSIKNGDLDWNRYTSVFKIPDNTTMIQPRLAAGYVKEKKRGKGITWFDDLAIYRLDIDKINYIQKNNIENNIYYDKVSNSKYNLKINSSGPLIIPFIESYDYLWTAKIDKINGRSVRSEEIHPILLYSVANGFLINQTGDLDITIEYEPQRWFYIGATISITTLIICIGYLIYDWRRKKNVKK